MLQNSPQVMGKNPPIELFCGFSSDSNHAQCKKRASGKQINTKAKPKIKIILLLPIKECHFYVFDVCHCVFFCVCVVFTN